MEPNGAEDPARTLGPFAKGVLIAAVSLILGGFGFNCWFSDMRDVPLAVHFVMIWGSFFTGGLIVGALAGRKKWWLAFLPAWGLLLLGIPMVVVGDRYVIAATAKAVVVALFAGYLGAWVAEKLRAAQARRVARQIR